MKIITKPARFIGRHFLNVRKWMAYDYLKSSAKDIYRNGAQVFKPQRASEKEDFSQATHRLHLSEHDLQERYHHCKMVFIFFSTITIALMLYTLYMLITGVFMGAILAGCVGALVGAHAFKYNFWMFQIKHKKLGCTFGEWKSGKINNKKNAS